MKYWHYALAITISIGLPSLAFGEWYVSKVVEVSTRSDTDTARLYIRTLDNPNPANCSASWNGAQWEGDGQTMNLAASIAFVAKTTDSEIKFFIDDSGCASPSNNPLMKWIQLR